MGCGRARHGPGWAAPSPHPDLRQRRLIRNGRLLGSAIPGGVLVVIGLVACGGFDHPLPPVHDDFGRLGGVRFGLRPNQLTTLRPEGGYDEEGIYREWLDASTLVSYGFLPWEEGRPPSGWARLAGVEIRKTVNDTARLREAWTSAFEGVRTAGVTQAECTIEKRFRVSRTTAVFPDTIRVTLDAEVVEGGDGRSYEAYLSIRMETPAMAALSLGQTEPTDLGTDTACPGRSP